MRIRNSVAARQILWRLGRKMYTYARGEGRNDPRENGEYWLLNHAIRASVGDQTLLDIGANKGDWTAEALRLTQAGAGVRIHAFEPANATRSMLANRFAASGAVTVHACAVSDAPGEAAFYTVRDGAGTNSLSPVSGPNTETTRLTTIDEFFRQHEIQSVSVIKVDTEGFDLLVLKGAEKALRDGRIAVIQFEYNWRWLLNHGCLRDVFDFIADKPYRLGKLVGKDIEFYDRWHSELDRFFETNYVLIRADSPLCELGSAIQFDRSSVATYQ